MTARYRAQRRGATSPAMRFASLGSGSEGNGLLVEVGSTRVLIDCGFGVRDTVTRLARIGVAPETVTAIIVTHEHSRPYRWGWRVRRALRNTGVADFWHPVCRR